MNFPDPLPEPGDRVMFTDPISKEKSFGTVRRYFAGRDKKNYPLNESPRDYEVEFDDPIYWNENIFWVSKDQLILLGRKEKMNYTVTSSENINASVSKNIHHNFLGDRKEGYVTTDEFIKIFDVCLKSNFDSDGEVQRFHPQDMYVNSLNVLEVVCNTLNALVDLRIGRPTKNVNEL